MAKSLVPASKRALAGAPKKNAIVKADLPKPPKKHPKKHAGKKHEDEKRPQPTNHLERAYYHLGRAAAMVVQLDERPRIFAGHFLTYGVELYQKAADGRGRNSELTAEAAAEVLRAAEHVAAAGLYVQHRSTVPPVQKPKTNFRKLEKKARERVDDHRRRAGKLDAGEPTLQSRFASAAVELLNHAAEASKQDELQLTHEFLHAAEALASALDALAE